ncbi:bromodomain-containing protein 7-like isoform X1 [Mytilus californianus]|uniref:bromodomain-containing protein 7-like isoform X1 n=1 Tax=Mytilus californianus TaxID=6549 RepID=UPI00224682D8|nr:bromodomain-containing protein 7-like isoform X1 [Mytilus californianus]
MKTKKHKKHKSERHEEERSEKEPLRLVLKVGESLSAHSPHHESKKHKHKKKKKKKSKDHHRREEERPPKHHYHQRIVDTEEEMEVSQEEEEQPPLSQKPSEDVESEDTEHDDADAHVQTPQRPQETITPTRPRGDAERGVLKICLKYIQNKMQAKDVNGFFAYPVNDMIAPGYSMIIAHPMDFSTMMVKIDNNEYESVLEYRKDFVLMCNNAMTYNRPETIYNKEAKRLFQIGMKTLSKEKLLVMKRTLPFMASLRYEELGIDEPDDETKAVMEAIVEEEKEQKQRAKDREEIGRFEAVPDNLSVSEILAQAQNAAKDAADLLKFRQSNSRLGFLRKRDDGSTSMVLLNPDNDGIVSKNERVISIGSLIGKLGTGGGSLAGYKEDKRNRVTTGQYLNYGPFGTYAPQYDSTFANMTKEETDILLSTYGDETGVGYAKSVMSFVESGGDYAIAMVDNLLDILTKGEHAKTKILQQKMKDGGGSTDEKSANIDFDSLRGLSDLGVDMSFLDSMEKSMKKEKDPVQEKLDQTATLLNDLQQTQNERLSQNLPPHITQVPGPSEKEIQLAQKVTKELKELAREAQPANISSVQGLRNAMGVGYDPSESQQIFTSSPSQPSNQINQPTQQSSEIKTSQPSVSLQASTNQTIELLQSSNYSTNIPNIVSQHVTTPTYQQTNPLPVLQQQQPSVTIVQQPPSVLQQQPSSLGHQQQPSSLGHQQQQSQVLQSSAVSYQTATASSSVPFQQATGTTYNQPITVGEVPVVGQEVQNAPEGLTTINDDDSDIEMDISEFLQFPSN